MKKNRQSTNEIGRRAVTKPRSRRQREPPESPPSPANRPRPAAWFGLFLAGVLLVKLTVALQLDHQPLLQPDTGLDTTAYVELARKVVAGDFSLGPGLYYVSPLYIYFLALVYGATSSFTAARVLQAALGTVSVALVFFTAREWFGRRAAWVAAALAALTGLFSYYEALILQASIDVVLTSAALWSLTLALRREKRRFSLLAGLVFGLLSLNRPNVLVASAGIVVLLLVVRRFQPAGLVLLGLLAGLAPVTVRNLVVAHQWSLVSSHGGINFYIGNGEEATGYFHSIPGMRPTIEGQALDARRVAEKALRQPLTDAEVSSYFSNLAWRWIRQHPVAWGRLLFSKAYGVFNAAHVSMQFSYAFYAYDAGTLLRFCIVGPWLLVPLGLFGLVRAAQRPWSVTYTVWLSFVPLYAASVALFFVSERYQLPLYVPLAIGAGACVDALARDVAARRLRSLVASGAALAVLMAAANWPLHLDDGRSEERTRMAEHLAGNGQVGEAERWTALALTSSPDPGSVHYRVGAQFVNSRQAAPAIAHLVQSEQLDPDNPRIEYALGRALLGGGRPAEALPHLRRAIEGRVDVPVAGYDLALALQRTGDLAAAARALRGVTPPRNASVDLWLQLGKLAGEVNAPEAAEPFFRHAVGMAPGLARAHHLLGLDLLVLGRYEEAAGELGLAAQLDPRDADALATLAYCEQRLGRVRDARIHVEAAIRLDPAHEVARKVQAGLPGVK